MNAKILKLIDSSTAKVECSEYKKHPIYAKYITKKKKYLVALDGFEVVVGDEVEIRSCKPISKRKKWAIFNVNKKNSQ